MIAAMTADGFIAQSQDQISTRWTSKEDAGWFARRTKQAGACVMGRTTFQTMGGRALAERLLIIQTSQAELLDENHGKIGNLDELNNWHFNPGKTEVLISSLPIPELVDKLSKSGVNELAICGGSNIYAQWLQSGLVNNLYLTLEPKLFGQGVPLLAGAVDIKLDLLSVEKLNSKTLLIEYSVFVEAGLD